MSTRLLRKLVPFVLLTLIVGAASPLATASGPISISIWDAYASSGGSSEPEAFAAVLGSTATPGVTIVSKERPFGTLYSEFAAAAPSGEPDLVTAPNDALGGQVRDGLVMDVSRAIFSRLPTMRVQAVIGSTIAGRAYLVPGSLKAVALVYDRSRMPRPPLTVGGWLKALDEGRRLGFVAGGAAAYYAYGFYSAFGGRILDREGTCVADQGGVAQALAWIRQAADAGLVFFPDGGAAAAALTAGDIDGYIEGNWLLGDFRSAMGRNLGVVPGPSGPGGLFRPLTGVDGIVVNAASPHSKAALVSALALTTRENQRRWMQIAGHVPADRSIVIDDPRVAVYAAVTAFGVPRPQVPEFDNYWGPFTDAFNTVVFDGADAAVAVADACAAMNELNGH